MRWWFLFALVCVSCVADAGRLARAHGDEAHSLRFVNGSWFDGQRFVRRDVFSVGGILRDRYTGALDDTVDLRGAFVVPPYADAHSHLFADTSSFRRDLARFVGAGVLYVKNPNNPASRVAAIRALVNRPRTVDVVYSNGGITATGGHPTQIYESGTAGDKPRWVDDAYVTVDDLAALDRKWPRVLEGRPDFIKAYLEHSEDPERRSGDVGGWGLDPRLLPAVVKRAHDSGLKVSCHVASAADFRVAMAAGVDEINHLPLERLTAADAREAARRRVTVVTTVVSHRSAEGIADLDAVHRENLRLLAAAGVSLALGTDNPTLTVLDEFDRIRALGALDDVTLLRLLVVDTARAIFPNRAIGSLADGAEASFIALEGNPLTDPANLRKIRLRLKRGVPIDPPAGPKPSIAEAMVPAFMGGGLDSAFAVYERLKREQPGNYDFGEQSLNGLGYALLQHKQAAAAVAIFQRNAALFPESPNVYDSLADGHLAAGDSLRAAEAYDRVLKALGQSPKGSPESRQNLETRARDFIAKTRGAGAK